MSCLDATCLLWLSTIQSLTKEGFEVTELEPNFWIVKIKAQRYIYITLDSKKQVIEITRLFQYCSYSNPIDVVMNPLILKNYCQNIVNNY